MTKKVHDRRLVARALSRDRLPRKPLARAVARRITQLGLSRAGAAKLVGDAASQMSRLMTGHANEFSADRLTGFLVDLGCIVTVDVVVPQRPQKGRCRVTVTDNSRGEANSGRP